MKVIRINPSKLEGIVNIPPSKSMAHRAIICAALSEGESIIDNIDYSDDIIATIEGMRNLGAIIDKRDKSLSVKGINFNNENSKEEITIDCNESGSTLRFLVPISIGRKNKVRFIGKGNLGKRPLTPYYEIFREQGIEFSYNGDSLNLCIDGELQGGKFKMPGNISSQFISGLLFILPILKENSIINITTELESKAYIDLTLSAMKEFGIEVENKDYKSLLIKGNQKYKACNYRVEGDYSQAAFYLCAAALGNKITCEQLNIDSLQGDKECIDILEKMGCKCTMEKNKVSLKPEKELSATIIDASQCPDVIPVITVVAALSKGQSKVINGSRLRIKECDRLNAICTELNKLGASIVELEDGLIINGVEELKGARVNSHKDHRIAMSLAIASTRCKGEIILDEPECVKKSYPKFWSDFESLGGSICPVYGEEI